MLIRRSSKRLLALSIAALAAAQAVFAADEASVEDKAAVCATCHGEKGVPIDKVTPVIWGQSEGYLYLQLRDFKSGMRKFETMNIVVADLSKEDMKALAAYFASKPWPDMQQPSAPNDVSDKAVAANASVACTACHLGEWQGDATVPRLAGQQREYMEKTIKEFRERTRGNNPGMSDLMNATPLDDLMALAHYLSGLQIQGGTGH